MGASQGMTKQNNYFADVDHCSSSQAGETSQNQQRSAA